VSARSHAGVSVLRKRPPSEVRGPPLSDRGVIERVDRTLEVLQGKWKIHLLFLMARGIHRHSRLLDCMPGVSKKVMTDALRALERDGLVARRIFAEVPARVEYSLTPLGWSLTEPLVVLADWGEAHSDEVLAARSQVPVTLVREKAQVGR
jgi:DNA-binding HxlR family transcriptional regulator